ncbi:hypothetical protein H2O84_002976 [Listeria monocytogenes]|nr:hypothetical protein [Listeria monocytogenes]MBC1747308.1 hypothetical protein [Listeria seeligeri]MBF2551591.1 hypothetical protein [Listeria seeligeri]MBF2604159.1 hypothetical protein [Listeria seeligeri]
MFMIKFDESVYEKLILFRPFIKIRKIQDSLTQIRINKEEQSVLKETFKTYNQVFRENNTNPAEYASMSLAAMVKNESLKLEQIDEILFILVEDSLFNAYVYKLSNEQLKINGQRLVNWKLPNNNKILDNIGGKSSKDFIICGYRLIENSQGSVESLRMTMIDSRQHQIYDKDKDTTYDIVYPTIVEFDFRRQLLHIRTQEIDNFINADERFSTMSGRIKNTLDFIDSFQKPISYKKISNFKEILFDIEENLLIEVREKIDKELDSFKEPVETFCDAIEKRYTNRDDTISTLDYVKTSIQTIIAMNIDRNPLGDIVGIRFRNNVEDKNQYSEITILDKRNHCISSDNLYWLNLAVLLDVKSVEFLKLILFIENQTSIVNLEFSFETGNIKLLKNTAGEDGAMPNQIKYDSVLNELSQFF